MVKVEDWLVEMVEAEHDQLVVLVAEALYRDLAPGWRGIACFHWAGWGQGLRLGGGEGDGQ